MFEGFFGNLFEKIATGILGSLATGLVTQGLNQAFSPRPPSQQDVMRDLQMQGEALRGTSQPVQTPAQQQIDQQTIEANQARQATFTNLSKEYADLQAAGPNWNPYDEQQIKREAAAEATLRFPGMGESGQTQEFINQRLRDYRLKAAGVHETKLSNLRQQMSPYTGVQAAGQPAMSPTPTVSPLPRTVPSLFKSEPFNLGAVAPDEQKKKSPYVANPGEEQYALTG